jgi:hypothetical protein
VTYCETSYIHSAGLYDMILTKIVCKHIYMRFEVFTAASVHMIPWIMIPCGVVHGYHCFGGTYYLHVQCRRWGQYVFLKRQCEHSVGSFNDTINLIGYIVPKETVLVSCEFQWQGSSHALL